MTDQIIDQQAIKERIVQLIEEYAAYNDELDDNSGPLFYCDAQKSFSAIPWPDSAVRVRLEDVPAMVDQWMEENFATSNVMAIYICPDNALVSWEKELNCSDQAELEQFPHDIEVDGLLEGWD